MIKNKSQIELLDMSFGNTSDKEYHAIGEVKNYKVFICKRKEIAGFVANWHYSKNVNGLTVDYNFKLMDENNNLIGAMMYGTIAMAGVWKKYVEKEEDLIELRRLCCIDKTPKNTESYFIGKTLKWLKQNTNFKKVISYADTTYNHEGIIYKASNFKHVGFTTKGKVIMYEGQRFHDKTIRTVDKNGIKPYAKKIIKALETGEAKYVETKPKHIYIYNLRREKK